MMNTPVFQTELNVAITMPGAIGVICIHLDRFIGIPDDTDRYKYTPSPEFELALSLIPGLILNSVWTRFELSKVTTEYNIAVDLDELCLNIANAMGEFFGVNGVVHLFTES